MVDYKKYIVSDPNVLLGNPIIKDTRISVEFILKKLSEGATVQNILEDFGISEEQIYAVLNYASARIGDTEEQIVKQY
ncbi:MAG: DUF433 domain-containing protein [Leeuwenhoekiella sp.]